MKTRALKNYSASVGCEAYDIDWTSPEELAELGKLAAGQCVVFVNQNIPVETLARTMRIWGDPSNSNFHDYISSRKIQGRHWRDVFLALSQIVTDVPKEFQSYVTRVTYRKDNKGNPQGIFTNGELGWHSDQCAFDDAQRIIGLQSLEDSANSQTTFLCTHDAYESLSSDMKSTVKELFCRHKWRDGVMAPGLNSVHSIISRYNMVPLDGMETSLYRETATGLPGIKLPTHSYDGFVGMSLEESNKIMSELRKAVFQDRYIYTQDWQDGQMMLMDQEITLHARPTNIGHGNRRLMSRTICYVNNILPNQPRQTHIRFNGQLLSYDEMSTLVDQERRKIFNEEQHNQYASSENELYCN